MYIKLAIIYKLAYDLNEIEVAGFYNDSVVLKIHKDKLLLDSLEIDWENSDTQNSKTWLSKKFSTEDQEDMYENATTTTRTTIEENKEIFNTGMSNLKEQLKSLVQSLGYSDCVIEEI